MARNVLFVGATLLSIGGIGIIVGLAWLTAGHLHGTLPVIFDARAEKLLFLVPAMLFTISLLGATLVAGALTGHPKGAPTKDKHAAHRLRIHPHFHA